MFITNWWHSLLGLPVYERAWHAARVHEEMEELRAARGFFNVWSEMSDVVYDFTRARWGGYRDIKWPLLWRNFFVGLLYMFPKYTLRYLFFYTVGKRLHAQRKMTEVQNPRKDEKLRRIAVRYNLKEDDFVAECHKLARFWPLLK